METILAIFTGILAFAVLMQTLLFFGIYRSVRRIVEWMDGAGKDLLKNVNVISSKVDECLVTVKGIGEELKPIAAKIGDAVEIAHKRIVAMDAFLSETTGKARVEILRLQNTLQSAIERVNEVVERLCDSILIPINEINAIARGIRTGLDFLFGRRKSITSRSAHDEGMFI